MTHYYLGYISLALYIASFLCYARFLYVPDLWLGRMATFLLAGGIAMHYFALLERSRWIHTVPYNDLYGSMSLFAWLLGVTYLGLELFHRQRSVGAFVTLLLIVWIVLLAVLAPNETPPPPPARGPLFAFHVTLWRFPALDVLDRMARSSVYVGLAALIMGVIMGFVWEHRLSGGYSWGDPKVLITLAILAAYVAYLRLSRSTAWRGARAAKLCAFNFAVVLFSYTFVNLYLTRFHRFF
jgi:ABC-type transport system involved in cytochrome c biogenesis permease subunit